LLPKSFGLQYFDTDRTRWRLFQTRVIGGFIPSGGRCFCKGMVIRYK
jgi:hypothetical protein